MSKAIIVIDEMPKHCSDCQMWEAHEDWGEYVGRCVITNGCRRRTIGRTAWCPLRETPEFRAPADDSEYAKGYSMGYDAALTDLNLGYF